MIFQLEKPFHKVKSSSAQLSSVQTLSRVRLNELNWTDSVILTDLQLFHLQFSPLSQVSNTLKSDLNKSRLSYRIIENSKNIYASCISTAYLHDLQQINYHNNSIIRFLIYQMEMSVRSLELAIFIRSKLWDIMKKEKNYPYEGVTAE